MDAVDPARYAPITKGYQIGVDVGQQVDPTAFCIAELQLRNYRRIHPTDGDEWQYGEVTGGEIHYVIRHLERLELRTPYPQVVERLKVLYHTTQGSTIFPAVEASIEDRFAGRQPPKPHNLHFQVYLDATGVGRPIVDACEAAGLDINAVTLTGGEKEAWNGREVRLSKQVMVSRMQMTLQNRIVHLPTAPAATAAQAQAVADELLNYEIRVTENANLQMGVFKTGKHDDLATALALACWPLIDNALHFKCISPDEPLWDMLYGRP